MSRELTDYLNAHYPELSRVIVTNRKGQKVAVLNAGHTLALAMMIADRANLEGLFWWGQRAMAEHLGIHRREVIEHLEKLIEAGFIAKVGTRSYNGGQPSDLFLVTFGKPRGGDIPTPEVVPEVVPEAVPEAGIVLAETETKTKTTPRAEKPATTPGTGRILEKEKDQTAQIDECVRLDLLHRPTARKPGKPLLDAMRREYSEVLAKLPAHLTPGQAVSVAVSQRNGEPVNIVLMTPPAQEQPYVEPTPEAMDKIRKDLARRFTKIP
jgi:hypothetical protein